MTGNKPGTFTINGVDYPVTPRVYQCIRSSLYERENVTWVSCNAPHVSFGIKLSGGPERTVRRRATALLSESDIGRDVLSETNVNPITKPDSGYS